VRTLTRQSANSHFRWENRFLPPLKRKMSITSKYADFRNSVNSSSLRNFFSSKIVECTTSHAAIKQQDIDWRILLAGNGVVNRLPNWNLNRAADKLPQLNFYKMFADVHLCMKSVCIPCLHHDYLCGQLKQVLTNNSIKIKMKLNGQLLALKQYNFTIQNVVQK